jgi:hypothetical protein
MVVLSVDILVMNGFVRLRLRARKSLAARTDARGWIFATSVASASTRRQLRTLKASMLRRRLSIEATKDESTIEIVGGRRIAVGLAIP